MSSDPELTEKIVRSVGDINNTGNAAFADTTCVLNHRACLKAYRDYVVHTENLLPGLQGSGADAGAIGATSSGQLYEPMGLLPGFDDAELEDLLSDIDVSDLPLDGPGE